MHKIIDKYSGILRKEELENIVLVSEKDNILTAVRKIKNQYSTFNLILRLEKPKTAKDRYRNYLRLFSSLTAADLV